MLIAKRCLTLAVLILGATLVVSYIAGFVFLALIHQDPRHTSPLTFLQYLAYYGTAPRLRIPFLLAAATGLTALLSPLIVFAAPRKRPLHGAARFAATNELVRSNLLATNGIILGALTPTQRAQLALRGRLRSRYLILGGQQGVALAAPPRAGKGVGIVIPNALNWPGSLVCVDIKKENWTITAGYRASAGHACFLFDPFAPEGTTARWNPFTYVSPQPTIRINDLQRIAEMLYPDPPSADPFWTASARTFFLGIALYVFETASLPKTIGEVLRQGMGSDAEGFAAHWKRVIAARRAGEHALSETCVRALTELIDLAPVTASSVRKTFTSRLDLWMNPVMDAATAASDFDLRDLKRTSLSIYVAVNPDDLHRLRPVLSLFFQQAIGLQTRALPPPERPDARHHARAQHQVLMLLDEFTALGRIPIIADAIGYLPGYDVRVLLVIQAVAQLRDVYGPNQAETILKSLGARIVFAPKDQADARELSEELGTTTVRVKSRSVPEGSSFAKHQGARGASHSISEQRRPLLLPQEVKELGTDEAIVFYESMRPIRCRKIRYFADHAFRARLLPPPTSAVPPHFRPSACSSRRTSSSAPPPSNPPVDGTSAAESIESALVETVDSSSLGPELSTEGPLESPSNPDVEIAVETFLRSLERGH